MRLTGRRVALTGAPGDLTRQDFKGFVAAAGGTYVARLDVHTDLLVVGRDPVASKLDDARDAGVEIVDWEVLEHGARSEMPDDVPLADEAVVGPPTLEVDERVVRILDVCVPRVAAGPLTPSGQAFVHYVLDGPTLQLLRGLARAVVLRQPCLVEGPTSTSKTSAIRFLASLVGAEVLRVNLNGQTDTSELLGRYVPEGAGWRFQEGVLPLALRNGWWVILDEVNLAEPSVLERLNPCLERVPELVLTEGSGTRFGPGGDVEVHPGFRVFATMNPAEYAGRSVLSEAFRDRFVRQLVALPPGELELRQLLHFLQTGEHPELDLEGVRWRPAARPGAADPRLQIEGLDRVAQLFAGLADMARVQPGKPPPLGANRRERYVFSRRGVLALVDELLGLERFDPVAGRVLGLDEDAEHLLRLAVRGATVERMRSASDRERVETLVRSVGLG